MQAPIRAHIYSTLATFCYSSSLFTSDVNWICVILDEMSSSKSDIENIQDATFSSIEQKVDKQKHVATNRTAHEKFEECNYSRHFLANNKKYSAKLLQSFLV